MSDLGDDAGGDGRTVLETLTSLLEVPIRLPSMPDHRVAHRKEDMNDGLGQLLPLEFRSSRASPSSLLHEREEVVSELLQGSHEAICHRHACMLTPSEPLSMSVALRLREPPFTSSLAERSLPHVRSIGAKFSLKYSEVHATALDAYVAN